MVKQIQSTAVFYINRISIAFFNLKTILHGEVYDIGVKDLLHLFFRKGHRL